MICAADGADWVPAFVSRVYTANFAEDRDIADARVVRDCLTGLAADPEAVVAAAGEPEAKARLRAQTERAVALGIFGAPIFTVGRELFWGNERLETALAWLTKDEEKAHG